MGRGVIALLGHLMTFGGRAVVMIIRHRVAFGLLVLAYALSRPVLGLIRAWPRTRAAWRHFGPAIWHRLRWRWLARNLRLAYLDMHRRKARRWMPTLPWSTAVRVRAPAEGQHAKLRYPRALIRPDAFGLDATIRLIPGVTRDALEKAAPSIGDAWRCHRVQVSQVAPGRVRVRGLRTDPLTIPLAHDGAWPDRFPGRLQLGLDEWGHWRSLPLGRQVTGVLVSGLPGSGKTSLVGRWLGDLLGTPAGQAIVIDGKGGADFADWSDRLWILTGDELPDAVDALEEAHLIMRQRLGRVVELTGARNAWRTAPSPAWPLLLVVVDECATFYDASAFKGDREAEAQSRRAVGLTGQLIRKGGSVCVLVVLVTQRPTADAFGSNQLRENSALSIAFALKNRDGAAAALGDEIRQHPSYCPTALQGPEYVGTCTARLRTGLDPFVRLRVPELTEEAAAARAADTAPHRADPAPRAASAAEVPAGAPMVQAPLREIA